MANLVRYFGPNQQCFPIRGSYFFNDYGLHQVLFAISNIARVQTTDSWKGLNISIIIQLDSENLCVSDAVKTALDQLPRMPGQSSNIYIIQESQDYVCLTGCLKGQFAVEKKQFEENGAIANEPQGPPVLTAMKNASTKINSLETPKDQQADSAKPASTM